MRIPSPNLRDTQRLLWKLISAPEGAARALEEMPTVTMPVIGDDRLSPIERVDIYANMYFFRILDSLKEDFPGIVQVVGEDHFHNLITDYLWRHPSRHWSLRYAGDRLPRFLKTHPLNKRWPFLADLAQLEWAMVTAFDAPNVPIVTSAQLKGIAPAAWGRFPLQLVPSSQVVACQWPVDQARTRVLQGKSLPKMPRGRRTLLVWRKGLEVVYRLVSPEEVPLLRAMERSIRFSALCEIVADRLGVEEATHTVALQMQRWLTDELLAEVTK